MITNGSIKFSIHEEEWKAFPKDKQNYIKETIKERYGFSIDAIDEMLEGDESDGRD